METLIHDVRYAFTVLRRNKGFAVTALLTLTLGIGATTAVFSVVYGVLMRPLPYPGADRLVRLSEEHPGAVSPLRQPMLSNLTYHAWAQGSRTIERFAGYMTREYTLSLPGGAVRVAGSPVTPSLFPMLSETPALGRFFRDDEGEVGRDSYVVLSDRAWREYFNGDPAIVGRGIVIDGTPYSVIGVARPAFHFPGTDTLIWIPMAVQQPSPDAVAGRRGVMRVLNVLARTRDGVTLAQAEAEGTAAARTTIRPMAANLLFGIGGPPVVHVRSVVGEMTLRVKPALLVLAAGVGCVLLIACANVANLFLSRGVARQRELTVRAAIGASRGRLTRQLLTESVVVSALGGAFGLLLARVLVGLAPLLAARDFPRLDAVAVDGRVIAFAAAAALFTAIVSGLAPALRGARFDLAPALHGGDGGSGGGFRGRRAQRLRDALLVGEAAFAVLLLVGAALMTRSFLRLINVDAGYTPDHVLAAEVFVPGGDADDKAPAMHALADAILARVRATPGIVSAGAANMMPLDNATLIAGFPSPWTAAGLQRVTARAVVYIVTPGYAEALALRLKRGRVFVERDANGGTKPWVVNEEFARLYLPPDPIGYQWPAAVEPGTPALVNEIVGVVRNVLKNGNDTAPQPETYQIVRDATPFSGRFEIVAKTSGDPAPLAPTLRAIVHESAPAAAVETFTLSERLARSVDQPRFAMAVLTGVAALALALASVGLYGVLSYSVSQRRRELGVRAALGASRAALIGVVIREGLGATMAGLGIGLVGSVALTRFMRSALFGVAPLDPISFAIAPLVLVPIALLACALPANRAAAADPASALRAE
jgi:putative ABC transport system permease protein